MKNILLSFFLLASLFAKAQVCNPSGQTSTAAGYILPDSATNLSHGCPGVNYTQIMYLKAPSDTDIVITTPVSGTINAVIDSFVVEAAIPGLPSYLTVESNPTAKPPAPGNPKTNFTRLVIKGDSLACVKISGLVPAGTTPGINNLTIKLRAYLSNLSSTNIVINGLIPSLYPGNKVDTPINLTYYKFIVDPTPCANAVSNLEQFGFEIVGNVPNPFNGNTQIKFASDKATSYTLKVVNSLGEMMMEKTIKAQNGLNYVNIDATSWSAGTYMYNLSDGKHVITSKMQNVK